MSPDDPQDPVNTQSPQAPQGETETERAPTGYDPRGPAQAAKPPPTEPEPKFRRSTRAPMVADVTLRYAGIEEPEVTHTGDVSVDGMFVQSPDAKPVGYAVRFELQIEKTGPPIKGFGEVVWIRVREEVQGKPTGMGVQFRFLEKDSQEALRTAVAGAIKASGASGGAVPAPGLDLDTPVAFEAINRMQKERIGQRVDPETEAVSQEVLVQRRKVMQLGQHSERAAELALKRLSAQAMSAKAGKKMKKVTSADGQEEWVEDTGKFGLTGEAYKLILPLAIISALLILLSFFL